MIGFYKMAPPVNSVKALNMWLILN